jgi:cell division protease FtsH
MTSYRTGQHLRVKKGQTVTDSQRQDPEQRPDSKRPLMRPRSSNTWVILALLLVVALFFLSGRFQSTQRVSYQFFKKQLIEQNVQTIEFDGLIGTGRFKERPSAPNEFNETTKQLEPPKNKDGTVSPLPFKFQVVLPGPITPELESDLDANTTWDYRAPTDLSTSVAMLIYILFPLALVLFLWSMFRRTRDQIMGGGFLSGFTKSPAKRYEEEEDPITFKDVAGLENVKGDLQEIVDFLMDPEKFQRLGGRVPKGVLLMGPPGTGKTLLARAVAGEAGVPFFTVNGSEFIQMFVGVGASRVRDLFQKAKEAGPSIIFIDEIDAVGRQRGAGLGGGHDEREQTLNQILSEMDGFTPDVATIVIAATNRPDVLDPALLRPGRFDRHVTVDRPTLKGRIQMFKVHMKNVPLADDVDVKRLAEGAIGLTGADIRNLVNEAALWATRNDKDRVYMDDFEYARDKVLMGAKREEVLDGDEKVKTAFHEAGHALIAWLSKGTDRVHKVTVIPRGRALGVTQTVAEEDRMSIAESEIHDRLAFIMGGRAAERLVYDELTAGAENDLERATSLARRMVTKWGMSDRLGPVSYKLSDDDPFLGREIHEQRQFSEHTLQVIDNEVARILHESSDRALSILTENREKLDILAAALVEREEINENDIVELIGPSVHHNKEPKPDPSGLVSSTDVTVREIQK